MLDLPHAISRSNAQFKNAAARLTCRVFCVCLQIFGVFASDLVRRIWSIGPVKVKRCLEQWSLPNAGLHAD